MLRIQPNRLADNLQQYKRFFYALTMTPSITPTNNGRNYTSIQLMSNSELLKPNYFLTKIPIGLLHNSVCLHSCVTDESSKSNSISTKQNHFWRLLQLVKPEAASVAGALCLLSVSSAVTLSVPFFMGKLIDIIQQATVVGNLKETLHPLLTLLSFVFCIGALANVGRIYLLQMSGQRVMKNLRDNAFSSIVSQEMSFFDKTRTGELINRLASDADLVSSAITQNVSDGLRAIAQITVGVSMMFYMSYDLAKVILMIVPPVAVASVAYGRYLRRLTNQTQKILAESAEHAEEKISGIRTVRSFAKEENESKSYAQKMTEVLNVVRKESLAKSWFFGLTGLSGNAIMLLVLYNGGLMMQGGQITVGDLSAFLLYSGYVALSISGLSNFYSSINKAVGASGRLWHLIDRKPQIPLSAIVGPSGCGKSTIGSLLLRFYEPDAGKILIGETNINDINAQWLRNQIGTVSQEPTLFSTSIYENISYGTIEKDVSLHDVEEAAKRANAFDFINDLPKKFKTEVGERGVTLSGGQRQRVAIARALIKDPRILLLDEATSALDATSEHLVRDALEKLSVGRTTIIIAHRLSTVRDAHQIVVLGQDGFVQEKGSYDQLMKIENGYFKQLVAKQTLLS